MLLKEAESQFLQAEIVGEKLWMDDIWGSSVELDPIEENTVPRH